MVRGAKRCRWFLPMVAMVVVFSWPNPVRAQMTFHACGLLGALFNSPDVQAARTQWQRLDPQVLQCFTRMTNLDPWRLATQCVTPGDPRIIGTINSCTQSINQARAAQQRQIAEQQAAERAAQTRIAAEARARQALLAAEKEARKREEAADAAEKAREEQRLKDLTAKYGPDDAHAIVAGEVRLGMTDDEVLQARGDPQSRQAVPPNYEMWIYGADRIVLSNGKVTYVSGD